MANGIDIVVPDGVSDAAVIEIMQQVGASVAAEESLLAVETDKATAELPSPAEGKITELNIKLGDTVSSGDVIGKLEVGGLAEEASEDAGSSGDEDAEIDIVVPDGVSDAAVIELMREAGDEVAAEESLIAIETDKATAEIPAPGAGNVLAFTVKVGDTVSSGDVIGKLAVVTGAVPKVARATAQENAAAEKVAVVAENPPNPVLKDDSSTTSKAAAVPTNLQNMGASVHASPSVRQFARELGVNLGLIRNPSGIKGRITFADVKGFVKSAMGEISSRVTGSIPQIELPDFREFGPIEERVLGKVKQITGKHLSAGWLNIPLVTHFEEADITALEDFRMELNNRAAVAKGELPKTTALAFIVKAVVKALQQYPQFNSSLSADGKFLILKKYYNIGIAVDTPRGLLVPVIKGADGLSLDEISEYIKDLGLRGRGGKLGPGDMAGGSFTISSLGGLGGINFTPLVNPPEVAILGVAKAATKPVWDGRGFEPHLMLPFSLSYDHRVLDGGEVARFGSSVVRYLRDLRYLLV